MKQSSTDKVISTTGEWFAKLPPLPKEARELIVKITPWVALIFGVLGIIGGIGALGILGGASMIPTGVGGIGGSYVAVLIGLVASVLLLAAFPGTKAHKEKGWRFLFWSEVVNTIGALLAISLFGLLFALVGFYLIFQIKSYYK